MDIQAQLDGLMGLARGLLRANLGVTEFLLVHTVGGRSALALAHQQLMSSLPLGEGATQAASGRAGMLGFTSRRGPLSLAAGRGIPAFRRAGVRENGDEGSAAFVRPNYFSPCHEVALGCVSCHLGC